MKDFRRLSVWKESHQLTLAIYKLTATFPGEERFGLTNQLRRAAVSIPSKIAEGCGRGSDPDLKRFLQIAMGSACELEYQLFLAHDLGFTSGAEFNDATQSVVDVKRMLSGFLKKLKAES